MGGKNEAMVLPRRSSPSVMGVARSGSRLFSTFFAYQAVRSYERGQIYCPDDKEE